MERSCTSGWAQKTHVLRPRFCYSFNLWKKFFGQFASKGAAGCEALGTASAHWLQLLGPQFESFFTGERSVSV